MLDSPRILSAGGAPLARITPGAGPIVAVALHAGHELRPELAPYLALDGAERLREEDPHTARMAPSGVTLVEVLRSRFEVDLNRPRFRAVYQGPEDSWGLHVYSDELPDELDRTSRDVYDAFYAEMHALLSATAEAHGRFLVLDLHSYNHMRDGAEGQPAPIAENPEVNLGTGWIDSERWAPVVDAFEGGMAAAGFDCRENVKFRGGHLARWISETFPGSGAALAIEFKKTFMDEWSGEVDEAHVARIHSAIDGMLPELARALELVR